MDTGSPKSTLEKTVQAAKDAVEMGPAQAAASGPDLTSGSVKAAENVTAEDVLSRHEQKRQPMYVGRVKVHPKQVAGRIRSIKWGILVALLGLYYVVPWIRWDRGPGAPDQAVLIDMPARRAYFFWIEIWPQEIYYLTLLLMIAAFALFLATSLFGRVWCGFTCPQTVWTDLFMWVERMVEGDRSARIRLDKAPLSAAKVRKRVVKHSAWLVIALLTGGAWVMYFNDAPTVLVEFVTGQAGSAVYFFVALFTATTYLLAGWAREQVCTYMCPWPRFQAALVDEDSMVVTYESWRGEPRGAHRKGESWDGRGDCIDCKQCVAVCPTGIDIRDGFQLECIGCGLCVDACDSVMEKIGRPTRLVTFDSETNQRRRAQGEKPIFHFVRPRTMIYVVLLGALTVGTLFALSTRSTIDVNVLHDRNPLFVQLSDGSIRNGYEVKLLNKERSETTYALSIEGLAGATLDVVGIEGEGERTALLTAPPDQVTTYRVFVSADPDSLDGAVNDIAFVVSDTESDASARNDSVFRGPE
jgi:cytochrome c oxidase accessory protein FixG